MSNITAPGAMAGSMLPAVEVASLAVRSSDDEILTAREAQQFLKIGRTKLWDLTRRNEIPAYRVGHGQAQRVQGKTATGQPPP